MFNRVTLLTLVSMLILCLAGCGGGGETAQQASQPVVAPPPPPKPVEQVPIYELSKDDITSHQGWTSRNVSIMGVKLGDRTRDVQKTLGDVENARTLPEDYLTVHQGQGLFVYTYKLTGKARKFEVNETFAKKVADAKLKKLLTTGDIKYMREVLGQEEAGPIENAEDNATEYSYDSRGIRFVRYKVGGKTVNALRLTEIKKTTT